MMQEEREGKEKRIQVRKGEDRKDEKGEGKDMYEFCIYTRKQITESKINVIFL